MTAGTPKCFSADDMRVSDIGAALRRQGGPLLIPFMLAADCGLTEAEIINLRWDCVRLKSGCAFTTRGNQYKRYMVGLPAPVCAALRELYEQQKAFEEGPPAVVCRNACYELYTKRTLAEDLAGLCERLNISGVGWNTIHQSWIRRQKLDRRPWEDGQ